VYRVEGDLRVGRAEKAVAELNLQHEPVAAAHVLALVQAACVLGEDRAARCGEFDEILLREMRRDFVVG
jgi:hypothetical protein